VDWNDLRYFLGVARSGSLTRAAAELQVSQSTVSRRIAELEAALRTRLFARHQTGYFLTDEGRDVLQWAAMVEEGIHSVERGAAGLEATAQGVVRLATSENLAADLIIPALPDFLRRYPQLRLELVTGTTTMELGRHEADIALRVVRPSHGNLKVRRVGTMTYAVYATHAYLDAHPPTTDDPLSGRAFITWDRSHAHLPSAAWLKQRLPDCEPVLATTSLLTQIAAVRASLGLAVLPDFLAGDDLVRVIPSEQLFTNDVWLVTHADLTASARVRAVSDFLADTVLRSSPELSGRWLGA